MTEQQRIDIMEIADTVDDEFGWENGPGSEWLGSFVEKVAQYLQPQEVV